MSVFPPLKDFKPQKVVPAFCGMLSGLGNVSFGPPSQGEIRLPSIRSGQKSNDGLDTAIQRGVVLDGQEIGVLTLCINPYIVQYIGELPRQVLKLTKKQSTRERIDSNGVVWVHMHATFVSKEGGYLTPGRGPGRYDDWPVAFP